MLRFALRRPRAHAAPAALLRTLSHAPGPGKPKADYQAVVIGGGVVGCSVLYHLAKLGWSNIALLERKVLTAGSSWHAAGGFHVLNSDRNMSALQAYTIGLYKEIEEMSGQSCGLHLTGGVNIASTPERWKFLRSEWAKHRTMGIDSRLLTPDECKELCPIMNVSEVIGGLLDHNEGHLDCSGVTWAYAKCAQKLGAEVFQQSKVEAMRKRGAGEEAAGCWELVLGDGSVVVAEHVVNAGGLWAREVGEMVGVHLPLLPMQHHYIITEEIPELKAMSSELPMTIDLDGESYMRAERGGVLIGVYEQDCRAWSEHSTPWDYGENELLPPDLDRISPQLAKGFARYPALGEVGIRTVVNGSFTFAPDGNPLVGPVHGTDLVRSGSDLSNYWVACGVMAGFSQGGGVGAVLAEWMVNGQPSTQRDVFAMDVARFGGWTTKAYTFLKSQENYTRRFRISYPNEELPVARNLKLTPMHATTSALGAQYGVSFGLEFPKYFATEEASAPEIPTFERSNAFACVRRECKAVREGVGMLETGTFSKFEVSGPNAAKWLDNLLSCRIPRVGRMTMAPMLSPSGYMLGDLTLARVQAHRFVLMGSGALQGFHMRWFATHAMPGVAVRNVSEEWQGFAISGPRSRELLQRVVGGAQDVSNEGFRFMHVREMDVGLVRALVARVSVTGELGYEINVPAAQQPALYRTLMEAGEDLGLTNIGAYALTSLRLEKSFGAASAEYTPDYTPFMFMALDKRADFIGKRAATELGSHEPSHRLVALKINSPNADAWGNEPVWVGEELAGFTTSGAFGHTVGASVALAYLNTKVLARQCSEAGGAGFAVHLLGDKYPATAHTSALYDPTGSRMFAA